MRNLAFTFRVLSFCGIWLPLHWQSRGRLRLILYKMFSLSTVVLTNIFALLQVLLLVSSEFDWQFLAEILFTLLTVISVIFKAMNFLIRRDKVICLADMLMKSWCVPRNAVEIEMENRMTEFVRVFTIYFNALAQMTLACLLAMPLAQDPENRVLPFRIWVPYDIHNTWNYWFTYAMEVGPMIFGILLNVTTDVVVSAFVLQACTQLDMLKHRLNKLPNIVKEAKRKKLASAEAVRSFEKKTLHQAAQHHDYIIKYAKVVTETFDVVIVEQFFAGALIFSVIIYILTIGKVPMLQKLMSVGYLICMLGELYAYCWFGNEITLKSMEFSDDIYKIDWMALSDSSNKKLIFIMMRATKPIVMSYGHLVILNIESFKSILKVTYTAFNVLKESTTA